MTLTTLGLGLTNMPDPESAPETAAAETPVPCGAENCAMETKRNTNAYRLEELVRAATDVFTQDKRTCQTCRRLPDCPLQVAARQLHALDPTVPDVFPCFAYRPRNT